MPGKVKVKILSGRNLPVMDRSSDTTDAYVEVKLGTTTFKTDVCRKSLNPQWNSEWYRFELDDAELQDEPLQIRIMDHDTYSANDAIGKVYIDLNPLLLPQSTGSSTKNSDSLSSISSSSGGSVMSGWFPVYDTMHGIRGEVNVIVKVDLFTDFNKFRQSSCGVQFFNSGVIPQGYTAQVIHGFVEELVVSDDPEYQWIEKIRTPRASNEARQTTFFKLSGEVQRKIGLKVLELGGNCVIGYHQVFDLEGESGIVVRGIGTAVTLVRTQDQDPSRPPGPGIPPQISLPPYSAPVPTVTNEDQRTPSFLTLPKLNLSRLSPTKNILQPLSRLSPRLKRKSNPVTVEQVANKVKTKPNASPGDHRTHSLDIGDPNGGEPDFNYSMNILLQQEDGRKAAHSRKNRIMKALTSIPRSSRKIYKKFSSADDNVSLASKISIETTEAMLLGQVTENGEDSCSAVDDSFDLSSSSSSTSLTSSSSSSPPNFEPTSFEHSPFEPSSFEPSSFEPIIYNYEPVVDLSNIKYFPRRNSDFSDQVNLILSEKYPGDSLEQINQKREQEKRKLKAAERKREEEMNRKWVDEEDRRELDERVRVNEPLDNRRNTSTDNANAENTGNLQNVHLANKTKDQNETKNHENNTLLNPENAIETTSSNEGSPKSGNPSTFYGSLLDPNREDAPGRRYSDASQLSPHNGPQPNMGRRYSSSDIGGNRISFESVYGRRLSDLPDLVTVKMSEKKRGGSLRDRSPREKTPPKNGTPLNSESGELGQSENNMENYKNQIGTTTHSNKILNSEHNKSSTFEDTKKSPLTATCSVEIKVEEVPSESSNSYEEGSNDVTQQIADSFSFLDRGTPPMSEMDRVDYSDEKNSGKAGTLNKSARPYLSNKNRIAYKETIFTPKTELMLTVTEPSIDSSSSRQVSFDQSHDDLVLECNKEEIPFTGTHFLDLKPKLSKSYENLSSLNDEDLSPEKSFSLADLSEDSSHKKAVDRSKKVNMESFPSAPTITHYCDPVQVFGRSLEKLSEEEDSKSPSLNEEDAKIEHTKISFSMSGEEIENLADVDNELTTVIAKLTQSFQGEGIKRFKADYESGSDIAKFSQGVNSKLNQKAQGVIVSDDGDTNSPTKSRDASNQNTSRPERSNPPQENNTRGNDTSNNNTNRGSGGDDGNDQSNRNHKREPQDKDEEEKEEEEEEDVDKTPPMSRMSPVVFGDEEHGNAVNFLSYNVTKSGSLIGVDQFNSPPPQFQMSLMNMNNVSRSNPNLSGDTKVRLQPRDKSKSMFDLVIVSDGTDRNSVKRSRSSSKGKDKPKLRKRESKSAENISRRSSSDRKVAKQVVMSDESLLDNAKSMEDICKPEKDAKSMEDITKPQNGAKSMEDVSGQPASALARKDSIFARRRISITNNDFNRRGSRSNGNLTESVENMASTLLTRRGSINLNRKNSITRKMSVTNEPLLKKVGNKPSAEERETYESVAGSVLMRRDSVKRFPDMKQLRKQNTLNYELDRNQSQSSESIGPLPRRDPFGDKQMSRSCSVTSVSEYKETLRKLLKSQESIDESNETNANNKKLESQSLVNITEQVEGDENVNKSESNIHKMIAVAKPTSILKNKIDFVPIPLDKERTKQNKDNNQTKARNFFGEDLDLGAIEYDAKSSRHESSPSRAPYSRIMANREDPLESRYSHIIANRIIVKPKQPQPDTKIQNGKDLHRRYLANQPHLKSNDYLIQTDFTAPARGYPTGDVRNYRDPSLDSSIEDLTPLKFTDFRSHDSVMNKLLADSKQKAENELGFVLGDSEVQDEDLTQAVTKFIDAEIKAIILQRYEEGEKPLDMSVPSTESKLFKTQNFTTKFIEIEREVCATQRIEGHDKKKKSVLIIKSTEPIFSSIENTFVISTEPKDDVILTSKFIQKEKEHSTALRAKKSKTPECKVTDTAEVNSPSQKFTAEFIERERVYSSFQTPHLILCKKIGGRKSIPPPISDGLKTDSNIKRELELTTKFLQMEREYCALQTQTVVQAVRRSVDSLNMVNQNIQELIDFTQKFIDGEKKAVAKESINSSRSESTNNVPSQFVLKENSNYLPDHAHLKESIEEKISSIKKKSPSREKEESPSEKREKKKSPSQEKEKKKSPSQEKEKKRHVPTQDEIDMILKRQSYDFALSKMNMTGVVPNINAYKTPSRVSSQSSRDSEPSSRLHDMTPIGQRERAEPDYAFIISQSNLNKQSFPQDKRSSFRVLKNDENRMSREEVLVEENVKTSSEDIPKELKSSIGKIPDSIQPNQETTEEGSSPKLEIKRESSPPKGHTNFEKEPVNNYQQSTTKTKYTEQGTDVPTSENPEYSIMTKDTNVFEAVEPSVREYASPEIETLDSRTKRLSGGERLPYEESMDKSESSIVNFFSASMETIKSRFTGHSDDFSDFVENMESELAEAINDVTSDQYETSDQFTNKLVETQAKPSPERKSSSKSFEDSHEEIENKIVTSTDIPEKVVDGTVEQTPQCGDYLDHTETSHSESKLKESEVEESVTKNLKQKRQDSVHKDSLSEYSQSADVTQESSHSAEVTNSVCDVEVTEKSAVDEAADVKRKSVENAIDEESRKKVVNQESLHDVDVVKDSVEEVKVTKDSAEEVHAMNTSIQENGSATQAPGDVINESIQENLSPKSSASEILSDSTIDNQLNECRNCPHTKVDSLDFLSDEELKCASDLAKEEGNLLDQLKKLEAEKRRVVSKDESIESGSQGESTLELVVEICQEEVTLDDKSDDKSPDLVVTQETRPCSIQDEVDTFTTVIQETNTPKTKRKKKKKHHTSKEDLNQTIEPNKIKKSESESEISTSSDLVRTDSQVSGEKTPDLKSVEANVPPKTEDIIPLLKESDQLNVDSQEDNSASDTKSKSKKKKKKKSNKGIKEDSITINQNVQQEVGGQKEELIETEKEIDKLKPEPENIQVIEENVKVIEEQSTETTPELKEADDFIPIKKKKSKMTRHLTRAILDAMKGEAILQETDDDNCEETSPEDIPTDRVQTESTYTDETCEDNTPDKVHLESTYTHETSEDNQGIYEDTPEYFEGVCRLDDVCEEDEEFCRLDDECEEDEEFCRLDEVCDTIPEEESANEDNEFEHVGEVPRNESVKKTQSVSVQTSLDNQATTKQELVEKQANSIQESKPLESIKNQATSTKESIGNQATTIQESMETQTTSEQESAQRHSSSSPPQITSPPEHRVDINTGLDVINCRLDIINQEISTIAHVLSNINNEIKHGSSTVVLDAALELSDRTSKLIKGVRGGHTAEPDAGKEDDNAR
uniref:C2 domain-containing protein 5 n=1 Tax=Cacopsylla melanoneura TaxID=428564 RepID=A0A8D8S2H5_9HEMI